MGDTPTAPTETRRSAWTWPLVALVGILIVLLIGALIAVFAQPSTPEPDPTDTPTSEPTASETPTPSPTIETVLIVEEEWLGLTRAAIDAKVAQLGLRLDPVEGNIAPTSAQQGLSYQINPRSGVVQLDAVITVFFYAPIPTPPQPANLAIDPGSGPYPGETDVILNWPAYSECPAGFPLSGYNFTIVGGAPAQANPLPASANQLTVTLAASGQMRVTYVALCGSLQSQRSNELAITIEPAP
jgi:serine/threonine-protein kinase